MTEEDIYVKSLRHALEYLHIVAARRGIDSAQLIAEFDPGRPPDIYTEHILHICVRGTDIAVSAENIPHDWIEIGTGFIDTRFSQRIAILLSELEKKWVEG